MRVGVIRGDVSSPFFLADLQPTSQVNFPTEPAGQTRYVSRPTPASVGPFLKTVPASLASTGNISFPVTINGTNNYLKLTDLEVTIPSGTYADILALVTAVNQSLAGTGYVAEVFSATKLVLKTTATGEGTTIHYDSTVGGSTFNTPAALNAAGASHTVPSAGAYIFATLPVGGPLDLSVTNIRNILGWGLSASQLQVAADVIAPRFVESDIALNSFLVGDLHDLTSPQYNPDPYRLPAIASGPAIAVVADDGVTPFSLSLPSITGAALDGMTGDLTITGVSLAGIGLPNAEALQTKVKFYLHVPVSLDQYFIVKAGGTVSATSIVIPHALLPAGTKAGVNVQVQYKSFVTQPYSIS